MTRTALLSRVSVNPNICFGKPCNVRGPVSIRLCGSSVSWS